MICHKVERLLLVIILMLVPMGILYPTVLVNEMMSSNAKTIQDEDGDFPDWIELYNSGSQIMNLNGWAMSDDEDEIKWVFPDVNIPVHGFLIVFCSGKNKFDGTYYHTNFKISSSGEEVFLFDNKNKLIDKADPVQLQTEISYGRYPDGSSKYEYFFNPTPGMSNNSGVKMNEVEFSHNGGFYTGTLDLSINLVSLEDTLFYTLNGSIPTSQSLKYDGPIRLKGRKGDTNVFSMIRTNPEDCHGYAWKPPDSLVYKATVVRAASFNQGIRTSKIETATYFIDPEIYGRYTFPIISIVSDSMNFFGFDDGIYVPGKIWFENPDYGGFWKIGNYSERGDEWERPVHIEFFETTGEKAFSQDAGVRIHGSGGRSFAEKSLRFYARSKYGKSTFDYQLFPIKSKKEYKRFILRNSGQDFLWTMFADALIQDLSRNTGIEMQEWRPSVVFINGEYWGILNIRDRYDENYLQRYCDAETDQIEICDRTLLLDPTKNEHFNNLYQFILTHDLSDSRNFDFVEQNMDIENYINYCIQKIYFGVYDWPGNNVELWRANDPGTKWRWLSFDNDDGLMYPEINFIEHITADSSENGRNPPHSTFLFRSFIKNHKFVGKFLSLLQLRMNTVFRTERVVKRIDEFTAIYEPEIDEQIARWHYPKSREYWYEQIERLKDFAVRRPEVMLEDIKEYFDVDLIYYDSTNFSDNGLKIFPNPNTGIFDLEIKSNATGYYFIRIFDIFGREVLFHTKTFFWYYDYITIDLPNVPPGLYFINVNINGELLVEKLVVN